MDLAHYLSEVRRLQSNPTEDNDLAIRANNQYAGIGGSFNDLILFLVDEKGWMFYDDNRDRNKLKARIDEEALWHELGPRPEDDTSLLITYREDVHIPNANFSLRHPYPSDCVVSSINDLDDVQPDDNPDNVLRSYFIFSGGHAIGIKPSCQGILDLGEYALKGNHLIEIGTGNNYDGKNKVFNKR